MRRQFPVADIDSNATRRLEDGSLEAMTLDTYTSRTLQIGELALLVDVNDGEDDPFVTWGRVTSTGRVVTFKIVGEAIGHRITGAYLYVKKAGAWPIRGGAGLK